MSGTSHPDDPGSVCDDCKHADGRLASDPELWDCRIARTEEYGPAHPITGAREVTVLGVVRCTSKNSDGKCADFERTPPSCGGGRTM